MWNPLWPPAWRSSQASRCSVCVLIQLTPTRAHAERAPSKPMHTLGQTRSANQRDHILHTPDAFVRTALPHIQGGTAIVHVSPVTGAGFTQYTVELESGGTLAPAAHQRVAFVLEGAAELSSAN